VIILGIDPGINFTGFGLIQYEKKEISLIDFGCITNAKEDNLTQRLNKTYQELKRIIEKYNPDEVVMEEIFFNKNTRTALTVSKVSGAIALTIALIGLKLYEYTPLQVKQATVGNGRADKFQVQSMVKVLLHLSKIPKPDHAADALAVAICHVHTKY